MAAVIAKLDWIISCITASRTPTQDDGHVSILNSSVMALDWLAEHASHR
jgi:hypothetical protein